MGLGVRLRVGVGYERGLGYGMVEVGYGRVQVE